MKISQMLKREDFYSINEKTLSEYFKESNKSCRLYVYPYLNAIVTKNPSKAVKKYLYCEYSVRGSLLKSLLVKAYVVVCLNSCGIMAAKKLDILGDMNKDMLIYPCNKKYRIFDFSKNIVDVIAKSGFPKNDLENEINFRTKNKEEFIPKLIFATDSGYREKIIDGMPLARISENFEELKIKAINTLYSFASQNGMTHSVKVSDYIKELNEKISAFTQDGRKNIDKELLLDVVSKLSLMADKESLVELTLSHGDLQSGNIWIEKGGKLYIIDWESWGERSAEYDRAVLFENIHTGGFEDFVKNCEDKTKLSIICLEDIIFRLNEVYNLALDYGEKEFYEYLKLVKDLISD